MRFNLDFYYIVLADQNAAKEDQRVTLRETKGVFCTEHISKVPHIFRVKIKGLHVTHQWFTLHIKLRLYEYQT